MNKRDLSYAVGDVLDSPRCSRHGEAWDATSAVFEAIANALHNGDSVYVRGFGRFKRVVVPAKVRTFKRFYRGSVLVDEETVTLPAKVKIVFQPSLALKRYINEPQP